MTQVSNEIMSIGLPKNDNVVIKFLAVMCHSYISDKTEYVTLLYLRAVLSTREIIQSTRACVHCTIRRPLYPSHSVVIADFETVRSTVPMRSKTKRKTIKHCNRKQQAEHKSRLEGFRCDDRKHYIT